MSNYKRKGGAFALNESKDTQSIAESRQRTRRLILWVACGGYLLYLSYALGLSLRMSEVPAGTETLIAWAGCIVFGLVGLTLLVLSARLAIRSFRSSMKALDQDGESGGDGET